MGFYWLFDPTIMILLPALVITMYAQAKVKGTFAKYSTIKNSKGITGAEVTKFLLEANGIRDVKVEHINGTLNDHYDPRSKVIRLSDAVYGSTSLAAIGVAAHETGHAIQDEVGYSFLRLRHSIFPAVAFFSNISMPLFFMGLIFGYKGLTTIGILFFCATLVFQLVTLPVEFNASNRAMSILEENNVINREEIKPARKVLDAAALTYVAAVVMSIANLLRLIAIANRDDR